MAMTCKLNDHVLKNDPTTAELLLLSHPKSFPGGSYLAMIEGQSSLDPQKFERGLLQVLRQKTFLQAQHIAHPKCGAKKGGPPLWLSWYGY